MLANLAEAHPDAMSLAIAGLLEPALVPPHRLSAPLAGAHPPVPIQELVARLADGQDSALVTPGLHRFLGRAERDDWKEVLAAETRWTTLGCEPATDHGISRLGAEVAWLCYARGEGKAGRSAVTVLYTSAWRAADVEGYGY